MRRICRRTFGTATIPVAAQPWMPTWLPVRVGTTVDEAERLLILRTLESTGQNKTRAAEILGVSLKTLHNKLKEYSQAREDHRLHDLRVAVDAGKTASCLISERCSEPCD